MLEQAELNALKDFAVEHGRRWKSILRDRWEHANCSAELQRVRNKIGPSGLAAIRKADLDAGKLPPTPQKEFEERTSIMPDVVARTCIGRLDHSLNAEQVEWFVHHVDVWTRWFHANNAKWRRKLDSRDNAGRDFLYTFAEHWAAAYVLNPIRYQRRHPIGTLQNNLT
jgi:hypothetical protein